MNRGAFRPHHHIPIYSGILFQALKTPLLIFFALGGNFLTFSSAYVFFIFEKEINPNVNHYIDAAWWALCTVSTVGYGDIVPMTLAGRATGAFLIIVGVTFFLSYMAVLVSIMGTIISDSKRTDI